METEVEMICAELERLEAQFDDIVSALEDPALTDKERKDLEEAHARLIATIKNHQQFGHSGGPCFEEEVAVE